MRTPRRTFIVRITTELSFPDFTAQLTQAGDVEHVQLRDGSVNPLTSNTVLPYEKGQHRVKRQYSPQGLATLRAAAAQSAKQRRQQIILVLAGILRRNAHAPLVKLVDLMQASGVGPTRNSKIAWTEESVRRYIDEALELVTAPDAPRVEG